MGCGKSRAAVPDKLPGVGDAADGQRERLDPQFEEGGGREEDAPEQLEPASSSADAAGAALQELPERKRPVENLMPAPPSADPDPEALALISTWIGQQKDLKVTDAVAAEALTYEKVVLADSSVFEGQLRGEDRHGWGKFTWDDGGAYEGQFDGNDMHGQGTYRWADGSEYRGVWTRNQMGPSGTMQWTDGRQYSGEFVDGRKHGEGKIVWPDGRAYSGQWRSGKQHGFGVTVHSNGRERLSEWQHGTLIRWVEDQGEFQAGKQHEDELRRQILAQR